MTRILIWDIPTRIFHWLLAGGFIAAFGIANLVDDESPGFRLHMLIGLVMGFMVLLRVVWGIVGSRHARFGSFLYGPRAVIGFIRGLTTKGSPRYASHNPGTSVAVFTILALVLGLAGTGLLMGSGYEAAEDIHEVLAWALLATAGVHLAGITWHTVKHRENIALSMVDGRKEAAVADAIPSGRPLVGLLFLLLTGAWAGSLYAGYDLAAGTVTLPVIGSTIQLGEVEKEHGEGRGRGEAGEHEDDEDDD